MKETGECHSGSVCRGRFLPATEYEGNSEHHSGSVRRRQFLPAVQHLVEVRGGRI
jgi:hypothetical protein